MTTSTMQEEAAAEAPSLTLQLEKLEEAHTAAYQSLLLAGFYSSSSQAETHAGDRTNRTHHLDKHCARSRSSQPQTFVWDKHKVDIVSFSPTTRNNSARRQICATCQANHPQRYVALLAALVHRVSVVGRRFQRLFRGDGADVALTDMLEVLREIDDLVAGIRQLFGDAADREGLTALDDPFAQAEKLAVVCRELFDVRAATTVALDVEDEAMLAAASAATIASSYTLVPNRKGRDVAALVSYRSGSEANLVRGVQELFLRWVEHCRQSPGQDPESWRPDGVLDTDVDLSWATVEALAAVHTWHVTPDVAEDPWLTVTTNWRHAARTEVDLLYRDWCDHYRWVRSAPADHTSLLVLDRRPEPMAGLGTLDRYDLLQRVLGKFAPRPSEHPQLWVATVPTVAARALDGYSAASGQVQAASLEGFDTGRLDEALTIVWSFEETFSGPRWFTSAAHAALSCLS
jgi:hypothetical protein